MVLRTGEERIGVVLWKVLGMTLHERLVDNAKGATNAEKGMRLRDVGVVVSS